MMLSLMMPLNALAQKCLSPDDMKGLSKTLRKYEVMELDYENLAVAYEKCQKNSCEVQPFWKDTGNIILGGMILFLTGFFIGQQGGNK